MSLRKTITILLLAIIVWPTMAEDIVLDRDSLMRELDARPLSPIEGIWQFPDDGAALLVTAASATTYDFIVLDSPDLSVMPGTTVGRAVQTAKPGVYDLTLMTSVAPNGNMVRPKKFTIQLGNEGMMSMTQYSNKPEVSFWRMIPYLFRVSVRSARGPAVKGTDGPLRVYPAVAGLKLKYL